jgi:hypothetical protein
MSSLTVMGFAANVKFGSSQDIFQPSAHKLVVIYNENFMLAHGRVDLPLYRNAFPVP